MYKVIYMKADYEPWFQFDGWEETIVESWSFDSEQQARHFFIHKHDEMKAAYSHYKEKNDFFAFWDMKEVCYCEDCEDDLQIYHGLFMLPDFAE